MLQELPVSSSHHTLHPRSSNLTRAGEPLNTHGVPMQSIGFDQPQEETRIYQSVEIRPCSGNMPTPMEQNTGSVQK